MSDQGRPIDPAVKTLLQPDEPLPFKVLNGNSTRPILLVCDHASRRFPAAVDALGLDPQGQLCHLAWDIGAGAVTERIAEQIGVTAVLAEYSRLVVDCNRDLMDPSAFLEFGDGIVIPGNRGLSQQAKDVRASEIYWPYHHAMDIEIRRLSASDFPPVFFSIHSFTPILDGVKRDCEIGVMWDMDRPTAEIVIEGFRRHGYNVGDNEPYSGKAPMDYTIDNHAETAGLPHVGIEIRHDLIEQPDGVTAIADILSAIIESVPAAHALQESDVQPPMTA